MRNISYHLKTLRHKFAKFSGKGEGIAGVLTSATLITSLASGGLWLGMEEPYTEKNHTAVIQTQENNTHMPLAAQKETLQTHQEPAEPQQSKDPRICALKAGSIIIFLFALLSSIPLAQSTHLEKWAKKKPEKPPRFKH